MSLPRCVLGIDPGSSGAVALLGVNGKPIMVFDVPTVLAYKSSKTRRMLDANGLTRNIKRMLIPHPATIAVVEDVRAMPGQGVSSMFSFGKSFGIALGVLAALEISTELVPPERWKKHFRLGRDKEQARALAARLYPTVELELKRHQNRAEALLLARYYQEQVLGKYSTRIRLR